MYAAVRVSARQAHWSFHSGNLVVLKTHVLATTALLFAIYFMLRSRAVGWIYPWASALCAGIAAATWLSFAPATCLIWLFWIISGKWKPGTLGLPGIAWVPWLFFLLAPENFCLT